MLNLPGINNRLAFTIATSIYSQQLPEHIERQLPKDWFMQLCYQQLELDQTNPDIINNIEQLTQSFNNASPSVVMQLLQTQLKTIYALLTGYLNNDSGPLSANMRALCHIKLQEGFGGCVAGIIERTTYIMNLLSVPHSISKLLQSFRQGIAQNAADELTTSSDNSNVHQNTAVLQLAQKHGYGVIPGLNVENIYSTDFIKRLGGSKLLKKHFHKRFQFYQWIDELNSLLAEKTLQRYYSGYKYEHHETYEHFECQALCSLIGITLQDEELINWSRGNANARVIMERDSMELIKDINWALVSHKLWQKLKNDGYIDPVPNYNQLNTSNPQNYTRAIYYLLTLAQLLTRFKNLEDRTTLCEIDESDRLTINAKKSLTTELNSLIEQLNHHNKLNEITSHALTLDLTESQQATRGILDIVDRFIPEYLDLYVNNKISLVHRTSNGIQTISAYQFFTVIKAISDHFRQEEVTNWLLQKDQHTSGRDSRIVYIKKHQPECNHMLHWAVQKGEARLLKALLATQTLNINYQDHHGNTPLHLAMQTEQSDIAQILINYQASIAIENHNGKAPVDYSNMAHLLANNQLNSNRKSAQGIRRIHQAIKSNDATLLEELIHNGAEIDAPLQNGDTPLHCAAESQNIEAITQLIEHGANTINLPNHNGTTPLHAAAVTGHIGTIELITNYFADTNTVDSHTNTPLHIAAREGHQQAITVLMNHQAQHQSFNSQGYTPLHEAIRYGQTDAIQTFIDQGISVETREATFNATPLHVAAYYGQTKAIAILLNNNALIDAVTEQGVTPLYVAATFGYDEAATFLIAKGAQVNHCNNIERISPLHGAAQKGQLNTIIILKNNGAIIDQQDRIGLTPFYYAVWHGQKEAVSYLHRLGAAINQQNMYNEQPPPLCVAAKQGYTAIVNFLINHYVNINIQDNSGSTPLHLAIHNHRQAIVNTLLTNHCDINIANFSGETPLHLAIKSHNTQAIYLLLQQTQVDLNAQNQQGLTPLYLAVDNEQIEVVNLLLAKGANPRIKGNNDTTPVHSACTHGNTAILQTLIDYDAQLNIRDKTTGLRPIHVAVKHGQTQALQLLLENYRNIINEPELQQGQSPLHLAAAYNNVEVMEVLINYKAKIKPRMLETDWTPLHTATFNQNYQAIEWLMTHGANPSLKDRKHYSPLHYAAMNNLTRSIQAFADNKADLDEPTPDHLSTPLHLAVIHNNPGAVRSLLNNQAQIMAKDRDGQSAIHLATCYKNPEMIRLLLDNAREYQNLINIQDKVGETPLHYAIRGNDFETTKNLIDQGANINATDNKGTTPLHLATKLQFYNLAYELLQRNASANISDTKNRLPVHSAANRQAPRLLQLLINHTQSPNQQDKNKQTYLDILATKMNLNQLEDSILQANRQRHSSINQDIATQALATYCWSKIVSPIYETLKATSSNHNLLQKLKNLHPMTSNDLTQYLRPKLSDTLSESGNYDLRTAVDQLRTTLQNQVTNGDINLQPMRVTTVSSTSMFHDPARMADDDTEASTTMTQRWRPY